MLWYRELAHQHAMFAPKMAPESRGARRLAREACAEGLRGRLAREACAGGLRGRLAREACTGGLHGRLAREACAEGLRGRLAREACAGGLRGRLAREACTGGLHGRLARKACAGGLRGRLARETRLATGLAYTQIRFSAPEPLNLQIFNRELGVLPTYLHTYLPPTDYAPTAYRLPT
jgi:hypothetical protein